ncbi:MAG TPA: DUF1329 domain-containing protein [Candidatus Binataceae bacterium]|nr:DUF1329 domain-containing protein [Candidatus Binataceae bacterium]
MDRLRACVLLLVGSVIWLSSVAIAGVKPGETIGKSNASEAHDLLSPGNYVLVQQGMQLHIVPTSKLDWPPPFKDATEQYASQVVLSPDGSLKNYVAGQPFPLVDPNDPQVATKVMWNYSFRPLYTDDADLRFPEIASYIGMSSKDLEPLSYYTVGHFAFYNNIGRIEVPPMPINPEFLTSGVRYRFAFYPFLEPEGLRGYGMIRYRHMDPTIQDDAWVYNPTNRRVRRESPELLADAIGGLPGFSGTGGGAYGGAVGVSGATSNVTTLDPDSYFGFAAKIENFTYKFLGEKEMLACVQAKNSPEQPCPTDDGHTICPEDWEMRHLYVIEANQKPGFKFSIPRRIFYIDSEGWMITASDQYGNDGQLWKTLVLYNTFRDRPVPDARVAIYPFNRIFQLGLVDANVQTRATTVVYMPGRHSPERECWYIDMGAVDQGFFAPSQLQSGGH